ncbi:HD domain-containing protein [Methanothermobacter wolfeii]|uniref:HD domain-containing protein n=1 Tax=Methanothermobacter wolfeii TaxID=145261 RepID=UPI0024B362E3|nr:HD domain-containing protein [Methanothermobacter wolfeii]MDI6702467.1 HD domain-containing protein [Methanothermobacter wolfeii]MDI6841898.1 HD domain-containing protein [Methanothermobacter wolfeii]
MKFIRDSVHGNLKLSEFEVRVVDTPQIQRLRRIKQLGFTSLIYPGANHSRFEHSIGAMYLASRLGEHLGLSEEKTGILRLCALLHDAGHGPFSHVSEGVLERSHESLTLELVGESELSDIISEEYDPAQVMSILRGEGVLGQAINGELDVDRMDYLLRDSHYTGVAYGIIDVERLIYNMKMENDLVLDRKGVQAAESALLARYFMYPSVYQHHTTRIVNSMFRRCLRKLIDQKELDASRIYIYDDMDLIVMCRNHEGFIGDMMRRLDNRDLLKMVESVKLNELEDPHRVFKITETEIKRAEEEIAEDMDLDPDYVIVNLPEYPAFDEMRTQVSVGDSIVNLSHISSLVGALKEARFNHADICVYVPRENVDSFRDFSLHDYMDLPERRPSHPRQLRLTVPDYLKFR